MKALITGASSGIGLEMAKYLSELGYDLIVISQNKNKLDEIYINFTTKVKTLEFDLTKEDNCYKLFDMVKKDKIDILINNAGFGDFGKFTETSLDKELDMINLSLAIYEELKQVNSKVKISIFCPGPVNTNFNKVANVKFNITSIGSNFAARYAIDNMFKNKLIIVPPNMKLNRIFTKISPTKLTLYIESKIQEKDKK